MEEGEQRPRYTTLERPRWVNDIAMLSLTFVSLTIIVYDTETSLLSTNPGRWKLLSFIDLLLIAYFVADLAEDHTRCLDRTYWWRRNGINWLKRREFTIRCRWRRWRLSVWWDGWWCRWFMGFLYRW